MRINKFLASAGVASRRKVEEFIINGRVKVNGKMVKDLATDIKSTDIVKLDNKLVKPATNFVYFKLNKPKGYVTTASDEKDRKTVMDLMRGVHIRVFPVGRLDYDTEGLLLLTNDGDLANILTKPNSNIAKCYVVTIEGQIDKDEIKKLSSGIDIGDYVTKPCNVELMEEKDNSTKLKVTITEGKNRQIRRMFEAINKNITFLKRVQIGEIKLGGLSRGEYQPLNSKELKYINSIKRWLSLFFTIKLWVIGYNQMILWKFISDNCFDNVKH